MTLKYSTGLRDALNELLAAATDLKTATTISFGDGTGTGGRDQVLDSGNGLAGFSVGDKLTIAGSASNNVTAEILAVAAGAIEVPAGTLATEAAGAQVILAGARGGSFKDIFKYGTFHIYTGSQPLTADSAETGTKLAEVTVGSGALTPGSETNGLRLGDSADGILGKESGQVWSGSILASGVAGWFRFYDNSVTTGQSLTAKRFDGTIATSGAELNMSNTSLAIGGTVTIDSFALTLPNS
jgi:hypothetical protein